MSEPIDVHSLPGTIRVLVESGDLAGDAPGLAQLASIVGASEHALRVVPMGARLDQIAWPCVRDARLALRAIDVLGEPPPSMLGVMRVLRAGIEGRGGELATATAQAACATFLGTPGVGVDDALGLVERLYGPKAREACRGFAGDLDLAGVSATMLGAYWNLATAARSAGAGWTAFHAHRGMPSGAATAAAAVVREVATGSGGSIVRDTIQWAIELASTPSRVRLIAPPSARALAHELATFVARAGHALDEWSVPGYPTGDAIVRFCQRALETCDAVLAVITAGDHSVWARRELAVQHALFGDIRPRTILVLDAGAPPGESELETVDTGDREQAFVRLASLLG